MVLKLFHRMISFCIYDILIAFKLLMIILILQFAITSPFLKLTNY